MFARKDLLAILAAISIFSCFDFGSTLEHEITSHNLTRGDFIQDKDFFTSPGLVYGSCHDIGVHGDKFEAKCTFVMETKKPVDSADHLSICNYDLNMKVISGEYLTLKRLVAISEDKAVVIFESYEFTRYFVLHFAYADGLPCKAFRVNTDEDFKATVFAPHDNKFELISTEGDRSCENQKKCKLTVNTRGHIEEATRGWLYNDHSELIGVAGSPNVGRLVVDQIDNILRFYIAGYSGMERIIKEYKIEESSDHENRRLVSMTHHLVSMCTKRKRTLICSQYDLEGERLFETEVTYTQFSSLNLLNVHNVPNGGLVLVLASCDNAIYDFCVEDASSFYVTKIDARGKQIGTMKVDKPARITPEKLHFFENDDSETCLTHVHNDWRSEDESTVVDVICFSDQDFHKTPKF